MSIIFERTKATLDERDEHVRAMACFFASSVSERAKLKRLRLLVRLVTPEEASWQLCDSILRDTLRFLTDRQFDWPHAQQHTAHVLLLELRAICLYEMEQTSLIIKNCQVAAGCIYGAARLMEYGLSFTVPVIHLGIDLMGNQVKHYMTPAPLHYKDSTRGILIQTYTNVAKRATANMRETARLTAHTIRDTSTDKIHDLARRMEAQQWFPRIISHETSRNVLVAVGTVGIASLGAAAIVGEAVVKTTASVVGKSIEVTASVVRYKYGEYAGRVVEDASHATGNVLQTVAHVTMLETTVLAKAVAKNTVKVQARRIQQDEEEESNADYSNNEDSLTALKAGCFESHLLKLDSQASFGVSTNTIGVNTIAVSTVRIGSESKDTSVQKGEASTSD